MSGFLTKFGSGGGAPSGTASGDLGGTYPSPTVVSLTGTAGVVTGPSTALTLGATPATTGTIRLPSTGSIYARHALGTPSNIPIITFSDDVSYPSVIIGDASVVNLSLTSQNTINFSAPAARIILGSAQTWISASGPATPAIVITPNATGATTMTMDAGVTSFKMSQADITTASATGASLTIQAQNATGTTSTGGNLVLAAGTGTSTNGHIDLTNVATTATPPSAGGASLPATALGFVTIYINGVARQIAYY